MIQNISEIKTIASATKSAAPQKQAQDVNFDSFLQEAIDAKNQQVATQSLQGIQAKDPSLNPNAQAVVAQLYPDEMEKLKRRKPGSLLDEPEGAQGASSGEGGDTEGALQPSKNLAKDLSFFNSDLKAETTAKAPELFQGSTPKSFEKTLIAQAQRNQVRQRNTPPQQGQPQTPLPTPTRAIPGAPGTTGSISPYQLILDKAIDFFEMTSHKEMGSDQMMVDFIDGKISLEELTLARTKVGVALTFGLTLLNQITQTFKEIQNMQV